MRQLDFVFYTAQKQLNQQKHLQKIHKITYCGLEIIMQKCIINLINI